MKVVLISPYYRNVSLHKSSNVSLGLLYLATEIQEICSVNVFDMLIDELNDDEVIDKVEKLDPDIVGLSVNFSLSLGSAKNIARKLRVKGFKGLIVFGGNTSTFFYKKLLLENYCNIVVLNEGEQTFKEIVLKYKKKEFFSDSLSEISGIAFKDSKGNVKVTKKRDFIKNLDKIKIPNRKYLDDFYKHEKSISLITSRGCPYSCFYCSSNMMWGKMWRWRSAENIITEIEYIKKMYPNITTFHFVDDNFLVSKTRANKFAEIMLDKKIEINFGILARIENIDFETIKFLKKVGLTNVFVGIESGSSKILQKLNRKYNSEEVISKVGFMENIGINVIASFMVGIPFETKDDVKNTMRLIEKIPASNVHCHIFTPFPGTPCYLEPKKYGLKLYIDDPDNISLDKDVYIETNYLKREEIYSFYKEILSIIYKKRFINIS